jgi:hypothetical protein
MGDPGDAVRNALDALRAQQAAMEQTARHLKDVSDLLARLNQQLTEIAHDKDLRAVLQAELSWLHATEQAIGEVRAWRREEARRFWPGVVRRWVPALAFALASAFVAGAGYAWFTKPLVAELEASRPRAELGLLVEHRLNTMTAAERRQLDVLMKWKDGR